MYSFDDPNEQISILNDLITGCINRHAPLKKIKFTRPPAPWMKSCNVRKLQIERNELRKRAHTTQNSTIWEKFRDVRNAIKKEIKKAKYKFYRSALSSSKPKEVWRTKHRIIKPNIAKINASPTEINNYFSNIATN